MGFFYTTEAGKVIKINTYDELCNYFDYKYFRKIIHNRPKQVIPIIKDAPIDGSHLLNVINTPPQNIFHQNSYTTIFSHSVDSEKDRHSVESAHRYIALEQFQKFLQEFCLDYNDILNAIKAVTNNATTPVTCQQAHELLLFCTLFAFVDKSPTSEDLTELRMELKLNPALIIQAVQELKLIEASTKLPSFHRYASPHSVKLGLTIISNGTKKPAVIQLTDCCLQRWLQPEESLLALTTEGSVVTFQPRICVSGETVIRQEGFRLVAGEGEDSLPLDTEDPVFFDESKKHGILIAEKTGRFDSRNFNGEYPKEAVCWLRGDCEDYGFLLQDGTYAGRSERKKWKDLLFFDLGIGSGVAVTTDRQAIDNNGNLLCKDVAAVSCCSMRWICLKMDGSVVTDQGAVNSIKTLVRTVCADQQGYWAATDETLYRLSSRGQPEASYDVILEEIRRNNTGTAVYGLQTDGKIIRLL